MVKNIIFRTSGLIAQSLREKVKNKRNICININFLNIFKLYLENSLNEKKL